jgi:hypothetical protein
MERSTEPVASLGVTRAVNTTVAPGSGAAGAALTVTALEDLVISRLVEPEEAAKGPVPA